MCYERLRVIFIFNFEHFSLQTLLRGGPNSALRPTTNFETCRPSESANSLPSVREVTRTIGPQTGTFSLKSFTIKST